jgi:hypothetical protein
MTKRNATTPLRTRVKAWFKRREWDANCHLRASDCADDLLSDNPKDVLAIFREYADIGWIEWDANYRCYRWARQDGAK